MQADPDQVPHAAQLAIEGGTLADPSAARSRAKSPSSRFIASRLYDSTFFIGAPLLGLLLISAVAPWDWAAETHVLLGVEQHPVPFFILIWTHAHLAAVFFRSHGNAGIFTQHKVAFLAVPILLFVGFLLSDWLILSGLVLAVFWATYHIGMQNFGLARIYDVRRGNPPELGRRLDYWLHQLINLGPFLAGLSLLPSLSSFRRFGDVGWEAPGKWVSEYGLVHGALTPTLLIAAGFFLTYYVYSYWQYSKEGYRLSLQKTTLLVTTAAASIIAWGFLAPWKAFFVMNFFHSLQYFALVWCIEKPNLRRLFRMAGHSKGNWIALLAFLLILFAFGLGYRQYGMDYQELRWAAAFALVVALMHYWYDGFIWSVRKREV